MKNVLLPVAKGVLIPLGLIAATVAVDARILKDYKIGNSNFDSLKKWNNVMKVIKSLEKSGLLIKDIMERIENETK